jgi:hypothetical protein
MNQEPGTDRREGSGFPVAFIAGLVVVAIVGACVVLLSRHSSTQQAAAAAAAAKLPFGPDEQAYASNIQFSGIGLARATNLLRQEFTYVGGTITNNGGRSIRGLVVVIEFHDPFNQVVLRDTQQLIGMKSTPLGPGQHRDFEVTLERVPAQWNQREPTFRVTGLVLQ